MLRTWALAIHAPYSAFPQDLRIVEQEAFSSAPRCKKSAPHRPCFTLPGVLLQAVRSFEHFGKR